jgi:hypothetical protein
MGQTAAASSGRRLVTQIGQHEGKLHSGPAIGSDGPTEVKVLVAREGEVSEALLAAPTRTNAAPARNRRLPRKTKRQRTSPN